MIHVDGALRLLMEKDPTLNPWAGEIRMRLDRFNGTRWHLAGRCITPPTPNSATASQDWIKKGRGVDK